MKKVIALKTPHHNQVITTRATAEKNNWWITYEVEARPEHEDKPHPENVNKVPRIGMLLKGVSGTVFKIAAIKQVLICRKCRETASHRIGKMFYCTTHYKQLVVTKPIKRIQEKPERNALCNCGSGLKYKKCCINKDHHSGTGHYYDSDYNRHLQAQKTA